MNHALNLRALYRCTLLNTLKGTEINGSADILDIILGKQPGGERESRPPVIYE